jgi:quinol monooxygenase YgiN
MLSHDVFFTLRDSSHDAIQALLRSCNANLRDHEGVLYFSAGVLVDDLDRPVNDQAFHVALHVTFSDRAAHDRYQVAPEHLAFIEENKESWAQVRVFDSSVDGGAGRSD